VYGRLGLTDTTIAAPLYECFRLDALRRADVYNLHNQHGAFWNFWTVPVLARRAPVVLTLHDEWLITGDCAYSYECDRWRRNCGACPQAGEPDPADRVCIGGGDATWLNLKLKRAMFRFVDPDRLVLVSPSRWLAKRALEAPHLRRIRSVVIPNGVDLETFHPSAGKLERQKRGLSETDFLVLAFGANLFDRRKNLRLVLDAVRCAEWPADARLLLVGRTTPDFERSVGDDPRVLTIGYVGDRAELASLLAMADLVTVSSRAENLPYAALEAQACGTPVLGSRVGGIPETLWDGDSGWLFEPDSSPAELAAKVASIRAIPRERMLAIRARARALAEERFGLERFVDSYRSLFAELAETARSRVSISAETMG
jgi:glycosyltransferase involved in cell wall biosynthesis